MDKAQIKKFSQYARSTLIPEMQQAISIWKNANIVSGGVQIGNHSYNDSLSLKYSSAVTSLKKQIDKKGEKALAEEAAYIWFNRIVALRFMEVNRYLPTRSSLFASDDDTGIPEIVKNIDSEWNNCECDKNAIDEYIGKYDTQSIQELYVLILVSICNKLSEHYGFMFSKIDDWTALLFPRTILNDSHILRDKTNGMLNIVNEDRKEVEIIGWIYQYYISEKKDDLFEAAKKSKQKFGKDELGAVTQLFTPKWIVKYMVQNTVGKTWLQNYPNLELQKKWEFYIKGESDTHIKISSPEELTLLDPACGSGHILVVGFDVLFEIYKVAGYIDEDIPELIIKNNLYGFEIDERAHQLACFAVLMKAKKYDKDIEKKVNIGDNIICIGENNNYDKIDEVKYPNLRSFVELWKNGKIYGSLMKMNEVEIDGNGILGEYEKFKKEQGLFVDTTVGEDELKSLMHQYYLMHDQYVCVVANPPYMGSSNMDYEIKEFINREYPEYKADLFAPFVIKCLKYTSVDGKVGLVTPFVWLTIQSYSELRSQIINNYSLISLVKPSYTAFFESAIVPLCSYCIEKHDCNSDGLYFDLGYLGGADEQEPKFLKGIKNLNLDYVYKKNQLNYKNIEGSPIAYKFSEEIFKIYRDEKKISFYADSKQGVATGNNDYFMKNRWEISIDDIKFDGTSLDDVRNTVGFKYVPFNKAGESRKRYGNHLRVLRFDNKGYEELMISGNHLPSRTLYFKESLSWGKVTSGSLSMRYYPNGFVFSDAGQSLFMKENYTNLNYYILGLFNSKVADTILGSLSTTMNYTTSDIDNIPLKLPQEKISSVVNLVQSNIDLTRDDRDAFDRSWNFKQHPFIKYKSSKKIQDSFVRWHDECAERFLKIKNNEEALNKIFNKIYGLQNEIDSSVDDKDITVRLADKDREIKSLLSYIIGCMMGRYSLDQEGLIYAGGEFNLSKYTTFKADEDGIIPILDRDYSDDDIVERTKEFVKKVWGDNTLDENLNWIAGSLDPESNKTADQVIRDYYNKEFYDNHCQIYQKRPIYRLFVSNPTKPKDSAFKALVYMHRYSETTIQDLRRNYVQSYQQKLIEERSRIENNNDKAFQKRVAEIDKINTELTAYANKLKDFAENHQGTIDLDDGVKVNYGMFMDAGIVAKIKL